MNDKTQPEPIDVTSMDDVEPMTMLPDGKIVPTSQLPTPTDEAGGWLDLPTDTVADQLEQRGANRAQLMGWIRANLVEGSDYGVIKGKKSLWKAGAEKIAGMLGLQVHWPDLLDEVARLRDRGPSATNVVFLTCELLRDGRVQAQGAGARNVDDDKGDWNKALKMAKKSAMIDAVLNVGGLSEVFTQDLDDDDLDRSKLSPAAQDALKSIAVDLFPDSWEDVLASLARRRFHIGDGDWTQIPSFRLADAIRSLEEKAAPMVLAPAGNES